MRPVTPCSACILNSARLFTGYSSMVMQPLKFYSYLVACVLPRDHASTHWHVRTKSTEVQYLKEQYDAWRDQIPSASLQATRQAVTLGTANSTQNPFGTGPVQRPQTPLLPDLPNMSKPQRAHSVWGKVEDMQVWKPVQNGWERYSHDTTASHFNQVVAGQYLSGRVEWYGQQSRHPHDRSN